jgi:hypothetical protein
VPENCLTKILLQNDENLPPKNSKTLGNFSLQLHGIFLQTFYIIWCLLKMKKNKNWSSINKDIDRCNI